MKNIADYPVILWDFDGVIMDSMPIRDLGFIKVLQHFPKRQVDELMVYHKKNGGLSRYAKFRYFYEVIRKEEVDETTIAGLAENFSAVMLSLLLNPELLIADSVSFIQNNYQKFEMHIVSGSDGNELNKICNELNIARYFKSISGSPTPKIELVRSLLAKYNYKTEDVVLIGDSQNDFDASQKNDISFFGYNNPALQQLNSGYIEQFSALQSV